MKRSGRCPNCMAIFDLYEACMDEEIKTQQQYKDSFGKHGNAVIAYIELFGAGPVSTPGKYQMLLREMKRLFDAEAFSFQKRLCQISSAGIAEALSITVKQNFGTRLTNDNYLKRVMITISEREYQDKSRQGEKDLRKREGAAMSGGSYPLPEERVEPPGRFKGDHNADASKMITPEPDAGKYLSREENLRRMSELTGKIGTISK